VRKSGVALILAPEKALAPIWSTAEKLIVYKMDIELSRGIDVQANVMKMPFASESVNLVWCHHVLEQVPDDRLAMQELYRILDSRSGELVISAGLSANQTTREFGFADKGLSGNRRSYGADFGLAFARVLNRGNQMPAVLGCV
jgi:SAM-dependent methyltransferase